MARNFVAEVVGLIGWQYTGQADAAQFQRDLGRIEAQAERTGRRIGLAFGVAATAVTYATQRFLRSLIQTGAEFERLNTQLKMVEGSAEAAGKAFEWIKNFAKATPLDTAGVAKAFIQLKQQGLDPTKGSLQAVADASAALGAHTLPFITRAIVQMYTKGRIAGEEMNQQLGEQGIPAWQILTEALNEANPAMNYTALQVQKLAESGALGRKEIDLFVEALGKRFKGAAGEFQDNWDGVTSTLKDLQKEFYDMINQGGFFAKLRGRLIELRDNMERWAKDGSAKKVADSISNFLVKAMDLASIAMERLSRNITYITQNWEQVQPVITAVSIALGLLFLRAFPLTTVLIAIGAAVDEILTHMRGGKTAIGEFKKWLDELTGSAKATELALVSLGAVIASIFTVGLAKKIAAGIAAAGLTSVGGWALVLGVAIAALGAYFHKEIVGFDWIRTGKEAGTAFVNAFMSMFTAGFYDRINTTIREYNNTIGRLIPGLKLPELGGGGGDSGNVGGGGGSGFDASRFGGAGGAGSGTSTSGLDAAANAGIGPAGRPSGTSLPAGPPGTYRNQYSLTARDTSQTAIDTIASEALANNKESLDAVMNNMFNRIGTKWGGRPNNSLYDVLSAPGQYEGHWKRRKATAFENQYIRERLGQIASGSVPSNIGDANTFRAKAYGTGGGSTWFNRYGRNGTIVGGNRFAYDPSMPNGPFAPYKTPRTTPNADVMGKFNGINSPNASPVSNNNTSFSRTNVGSINVHVKDAQEGAAKVGQIVAEGAKSPEAQPPRVSGPPAY